MLYAENLKDEVRDGLIMLKLSRTPLRLREAIRELASDRRRVVLITRDWKPADPVRGPYVGVNRQYADTNQIIHLKGSDLDERVLIVHELVHAVGGTELDAEVTEHILCRENGLRPLITPAEIREFSQQPRGKFYTLENRKGSLWWGTTRLWSTRNRR